MHYVADLAEHEHPITAFDVRQLHRLVVANIDMDTAGQPAPVLPGSSPG